MTAEANNMMRFIKILPNAFSHGAVVAATEFPLGWSAITHR
jgi:hypothetical protein